MESQELETGLNPEESEETTLDSVPDNLEDITLEVYDGYFTLGDGSVISRDNPLPVEVVNPSAEYISGEEESLPEETVRYLEEAISEEPVILDNISKFNDERSRASLPQFKNVWKISVNSEEYSVLFPNNASLEVVDGKLYNMGTSNITGIVLDNSFSDSSYIHRTFTILPLSSSSTQTTVYRYGSRQYFTDYSVNAQNNITSTVSYVQSSVINRPIGWALNPADWIICGLLLFSLLVSIIGGLVRR